MNASDVIRASFRRPDLEAKRDRAVEAAARRAAMIPPTDTSIPEEIEEDADKPAKPRGRGRGRPKKVR